MPSTTNCQKLFLLSAVLLLLHFATFVRASEISLQLSSEQTYWSMEEITNTSHNTEPFQAQSISGTIYGAQINYGKNSNSYEETSFEEVFLRVPSISFESSTIDTFIDLQTFESELILNSDFILYENGTTQDLESGTSIKQTVEVKELGLYWRGKNYFYFSEKIAESIRLAGKLSYKEYTRPLNPSENYIVDTTYSAYILGFEIISEKPAEGWGFYNQGLSVGSGFGDLAAQDEGLADSLDDDETISYIEMAIEPRFVYYFTKNFALDFGYLYKYTAFSLREEGEEDSLSLGTDTFQSFDIRLQVDF